MTALKITHPLALRLMMTDDLYRVEEQEKVIEDHVKPEGHITIKEPEESPAFNYLGENNKFTLIIVNDESHATLNSADLETLTAILSAKKSELRDVAILNLHKHPTANFEQLKQFFSCSKIVLFGINPKMIGLPDIGNNEITQYNGTKVLASYSFSEMKDDTAKKRLFWNEMKQL